MIRLTLPYPPSANRYWRVVRGQTLVSAEARAYKRTVAQLCLVARIRPFTGDVMLMLDIYRPLRRGDLSNRIKVLEDALEGYAFDDDAQVVDIAARRFDDKANPRAEVVIIPVAMTGGEQ